MIVKEISITEVKPLVFLPDSRKVSSQDQHTDANTAVVPRGRVTSSAIAEHVM